MVTIHAKVDALKNKDFIIIAVIKLSATQMMDVHQHDLRMADTTNPTVNSEMRLLKKHETIPNSMGEIFFEMSLSKRWRFL